MFDAYGKEIISLVGAFGVWLLTYLTTPKARMWLSMPHRFFYQLTDGRSAWTSTWLLTNSGSVPLTDIALSFNSPPDHLNVWPPRAVPSPQYHDGTWTYSFSDLAPKAELFVECLGIETQTPLVINARCKECRVEEIPIGFRRIRPRWVDAVMTAFQYMGAAVAVYVVLLIIQLAVLGTIPPWRHSGSAIETAPVHASLDPRR